MPTVGCVFITQRDGKDGIAAPVAQVHECGTSFLPKQ